MTRNGCAIKTAADNTPAIAIAITRVAVTSPVAIAITRVAVTSPVAIAITRVAVTSPVAIAVRRVAVAGPITIAAPTAVACAIVTGSGSGRAVDSCTSNGVIAEIGTDAIGAAHRAAMNASNRHRRERTADDGLGL